VEALNFLSRRSSRLHISDIDLSTQMPTFVNSREDAAPAENIERSERIRIMLLKLIISIRMVFFGATMAFSSAAFAQCAPGIPAAGNPGCIPPDQYNSPYSPSAAPAARPAAKWADRWGSIAMDDKTGKLGTVSQSAAKEKAESQALDRCADNGGLSCQIALTYTNQCVAVAQVPTGGPVHMLSGAYLPETESAVLKKCDRDGNGKCQIAYSKCSYAERVQ